ncbi:MAG: hypothetical protein IT365_12935 [Candidatus Hydrogenedentes bacterium]|nr:hypothetical protein [Candidatus Hydrogenedentota bacterium]
MAENSVVKEQLTDAMVDVGAELTAKLDELGLSVTAALWIFMPELNEWRLLFASPEVASEGSRRVYGRIREAIEQIKEGAAAASLSLANISLVDADADLIRLLKLATRTGPGVINHIRFTKNVINGHFIDDALIYRVA